MPNEEGVGADVTYLIQLDAIEFLVSALGDAKQHIGCRYTRYPLQLRQIPSQGARPTT